MISVNWPTGVITVPKSDTVLTGTDPITGREIRSYDTDQFWREIADEFDGVDGRTFPRPWSYNSEVFLSGTTYAPQLIVRFEYYTVEFEDGTYRVILDGTNNNLADVAVINGVSIVPTNSLGKPVIKDVTLTGDQAAKLEELHRIHGLDANTVLRVTDTSRKVNDGTDDVIDQTVSDDGTTTTVERQ